jgi:outer membrane protein OmpA-like peptidoglycan-associated protein
MKKSIFAFLSVLIIAGFANAAPDNYAMGAASTQPRTFGALTFDGAFGNPALAGLNRFPRVGLSFFPTSVGMWSNMNIPTDSIFPINLLDLGSDADRYITRFFRMNYGLNENFTPREVYDAVTGGKGLLNFYAGARTSPFVYATRGFALNISTSADAELKIPGAFMLPRFSNVGGYPDGSVFDLSDLRAEAIWTSEIAVKLGFSAIIPAVRDYLNLDKGTAGVGIKLIAGHSYLKAEAKPGSVLIYDSLSGTFTPNASAEVLTIGTGPRSNPQDYGSFLRGNPINGQGWGLDLGTIFHNDRHFVSLDAQNIGMILWDGKQAHKRTVVWETEFTENQLGERVAELFELDTLEPTRQPTMTWLPAALNIGYNYYYALPKDSEALFLIRYLSWSAGYRQQLVLGPGNSTYMPRFSLGTTLGLLDGMLPVRYGVIAGGPEEMASVFGFGFDLRHVSIDAYYKSIGSPWVLAGKRGFEAAAGVTFRNLWTQPPPKQAKPRKKTVVVQEEAEEEPEPPPPQEEPAAEEEPAPAIPPIPQEEPAAEEKPYEPVIIQMTMLPPPEPTAEEKKEIRTAQRAINFRSGGAELTPDSYPALDAIAELLKQYPHIRYEIQGHTDSQGSDRLNLQLSAVRAGVVKQYLVSKGAPSASLISIGYGRNMPIADNSTALGRAQNRRVEFVQIMSQEQYDRLKRLQDEKFKNLSR